MSCVKSETEMWHRLAKHCKPDEPFDKSNALVGAGTRICTMPGDPRDYAPPLLEVRRRFDLARFCPEYLQRRLRRLRLAGSNLGGSESSR
jgi:adenine-specific DNA glycosylase